MLAGIREIMVIVRPSDLSAVSDFLEDGSNFGISLRYAVQDEPRGIAEAITIAESFLENSASCLILGDNVLLGSGLGTSLRDLASPDLASVLGYSMLDPSAYAVATVDSSGEVLSLVEKPRTRKRGLAVPGIYFYPPDVSSLVKEIKPSNRGELEITDLNHRYLDENRLRIRVLSRSTFWIDAGTPERLLDAGNFVRTLSERDGTVIACPEDIAFAEDWITAEAITRRAHKFANSRYGRYLLRLAEGKAL